MTKTKLPRIALLAIIVVIAMITASAAFAAQPSPTPAPTGSAQATAQPSPGVSPSPSATQDPSGSPQPGEAEGGEGAGEGEEESGTLAGQLKKLLGNDNAETVDIILLLTILSLLPSILIMLTGFTRIIIVLSFIRNAMGMQQMPPNQVLVGLALFLTLFVMSPVIDEINETAYQPYIEESITQEEFIDNAMKPISAFMLKQTYTSDLEFFIEVADLDEPLETEADTPMRVLIPAFITSEIKRGFTIGFILYIPFLVIDMVVASALMSMGMMMLPPVMISLPFKVMLFIAVNGWQLTVGSLITSFY